MDRKLIMCLNDFRSVLDIEITGDKSSFKETSVTPPEFSAGHQ